MDEQILPKTYDAFIPLLRKNKDVYIFVSSAKHSPTEDKFGHAYVKKFTF
jgi:hypothetical protein